MTPCSSSASISSTERPISARHCLVDEPSPGGTSASGPRPPFNKKGRPNHLSVRCLPQTNRRYQSQCFDLIVVSQVFHMADPAAWHPGRAQPGLPVSGAFAFGIKQAAIPLATLLGGISVPLLALTLGWRAAYALASPLAALVCLVASRFRSRPNSAVRPNSAAEPAAAGPMSVHLPQPSRARRPDLGPLVLVAVGGGLGAGAAATLGTFLVIAAVDRGLSPSAAGLLAAGASAVGLSSRLANGALADHRTDSHFAVVTLMLLVGCGGYLMLGAGPRWSLVVGAALAYGCGWGCNGLLNFAVVRSYPTVPGRATSITQGGVYLGNVLGPLGFGVLLRAPR